MKKKVTLLFAFAILTVSLDSCVVGRHNTYYIAGHQVHHYRND